MNKIRELRKERMLSLRQLGELIGIDHSDISKIERGERGLNEQNLRIFADFFQTSIDYILCRTDKRPETIKPKEVFSSPYKDTQVFKDIIKIIDSLTLKELHMVFGVLNAVLSDETVNSIVSSHKKEA